MVSSTGLLTLWLMGVFFSSSGLQMSTRLAAISLWDFVFADSAAKLGGGSVHIPAEAPLLCWSRTTNKKLKSLWTG